MSNMVGLETTVHRRNRDVCHSRRVIGVLDVGVLDVGVLDVGVLDVGVRTSNKF